MFELSGLYNFLFRLIWMKSQMPLRHDCPHFAVLCNFICPTPYLAKIGDVLLESYGERQIIRAS